ncbi:cation:proton antiporter domain-containing protein [Oleiharenicola lentus]|uniref:cation:proton antiporter domain-containing protein n=1 Tax=Oleiharenicola lentus TaxID=2508720 RepID=UPI003F6753DD
MHHDLTLISTVAVGFVLAFIFGYIVAKVHLPPLVGYLLAGVAIGPFTPDIVIGPLTIGYVADSTMANQLAEIGVMLLMFGVGLHFSAADLLAVRRIAIPGAVIQIVLATLIGVGMAMWWGWSFGAGLVLGLSLSVASTVVLLKALEERNGVSTPNGRIVIGWLIMEDLAMVLTLVLLPAFAGVLGGHVPDDGHGAHGPLWLTLLNTFIKVTAFMMIAMFFGPKVMPWLLKQVARTGSRELFTLGVLAISLGIAFASAKLFDVSFALGAFFAGVVLNGSELSHKAAANSLPLQDAFAVLFFVSVGMQFDPAILFQEPLKVIGVLSIILVGKSLVAFGIVWVVGYPFSTAVLASAALAQIGEFSFILGGLGITYGLMPADGLSLILAGALISIPLNPLVFTLADRSNRWLRRHPALKHRLEDSRDGAVGPFARLKAELEAVRLKIEQKAHAHKSVSPEELVSHFPLFGTMSPEQRETLILHFHNREAQPGERIIRRGDKADAVYFISEGQVEVALRDGRKIKLSPGGFFGEMALLSGERRSADVTALDYSKFLTLDQADFRQFLKKHPSIREHVAALAAERGHMNSTAPQDPAMESSMRSGA